MQRYEHFRNYQIFFVFLHFETNPDEGSGVEYDFLRSKKNDLSEK